jgi:DNA-directed RNA polymerase specialized sigma24 family protein
MRDARPQGRCFPSTRHSLVLAAVDKDEETRRRAFEAIVSAYWKPVYKYVRLKWRADAAEAEDLTQGFFTLALEKDFFARYEPARARFRTYLRTCLDGFVANARAADARLKRGGGSAILSLDFAGAEGELRHHDVAASGDVEEFFQREWIRHLFALAVDRLRVLCADRGKNVHFEIFRAYDLEADDAARLSYADLAGRHGIPATQVTNFLSWTRGEFRRIVLELLAEITGSESEYRAEARAILGVDPS